MNAPVRVVVVGGGPAGMAAAAVAAECGCKVQLVDENPAPGGQIWRGYDSSSARNVPHKSTYTKWRERLHSSGAEILHESSAVDLPAPNTLRIERNGESQELAFDRLIIATGARERFLPFPGWTLPGVTGVGGLQALVKAGLPIAGKRVVVAGSGPLLLAVAAGLTHAGANVAGIFEQAPMSRLARFAVTLAELPNKLLEGAHYRWIARRIPFRPGWWVKQAMGERKIESVIVTDGASCEQIACDYLACSFHLVPNLELAQLLGCRIESGRVRVNSVQETSVRGVYCAGEPTGIGGLDKALVEGEMAGLASAGHLGKATQRLPTRQKLDRFAQLLDQTFAPRAELRALAQAETVICRCEDVTRAELESCANGRAAKLHARCGMGPCQARLCGPATEFLFGWSAAGVRPPIYPSRISTLAGQCKTNAAETHQ